ncbi:MAG: hypothetical protein V1863_07525 [Candidatus Omnitrophota bacterium]
MSDFFASRGEKGTIMTINGLTCTLNMPAALRQRFGPDKQELAQSLPPYAPRQAFAVDEYPGCPQSWMRGSATEASYFVPVLAEHGLWLDFNANASHTNHVAALISIQGINAVTGQKTERLNLEQYRSKCPIHNITFGHERFCEKCGYKWDAQNYLASNATPTGSFWIDGFRAEDGVTRQFVFTKEKMRGIAAQLIGTQRVFALGIAFFLSKEQKPAPPVPRYERPHSASHTVLYGSSGHDFGDSLPKTRSLKIKSLGSHNLLSSHLPEDGESVLFSLEADSDRVREGELASTVLEIGAGAKIDQRIHPDPWDLNYWQEKPVGTIYINYVDESLAEKIISAGKIDTTAGGEGFLQGLKVGDPSPSKQ